MSWFTLSLLFVILMSGFYFFSKKLLSGSEVDSRIFAGLMNLGVGVITLPLAIAQGFVFDWTWTNILFLFLMGAAITVAASLYYTGLQKVDLSKTMVLSGSVVFWTALLGLLIYKEPITLYKGIAILLVFAAVWLVSGLRKNLSISRYEVFILISAIFYAIASMFDKYFSVNTDPITYLTLGFLTAGVLLIAINLRRWKANAHMLTFHFWKSLGVICVFIAGGYLALFHAYEIGEVSRIQLIAQLQVIVTALLGVIFLNERKGLGRKLVAMAIFAVALYFVRM